MSDKQELTTTRAFSLAPSSFAEAQQFAKLIAESDMVPKDFKGKPGNVLVAVQMGSEVGLPPMQALQNIAVINGRPCIWGDAAIALARVHPDFENIDESFTGSGEGLTAVCAIKRRGQKAQTRTFSVTDAKRAKLWGKSGPWTDYPQRMLQMRARSWAIRDVFADAMKGISIREELEDITVRDVTTEARQPAEKVQMPQQRKEPTEDASRSHVYDVPSAAPETTPQAVATQGDDTAEPREAKPLSEGQRKILLRKLADAGIDATLFADLYGTAFADLQFSDFNAVSAWLKDNAEA